MNFFIFATVFLIALNFALSDTNKGYSTSKMHKTRVRGADELQFPWQVAITAYSGDNEHLDTGSIISKRFVLTAAHCIQGADEFILGFGKIGITKYDSSVIQISETGIMHPEYNYENGNHDIGLIYTPDDIPLSLSIQIIRLPLYSQQNETFDGFTAIMLGWGSIEPGK